MGSKSGDQTKEHLIILFTDRLKILEIINSMAALVKVIKDNT